MNVIIKLNWEPIGIRTQAVTNEIKNGQLKEQPGPHVALGSISYPPLTPGGGRETGALIYIKASLSGDESDYVIAYKKANPEFPHETTLDQLFSEEQFEAYRALGDILHAGFSMAATSSQPIPTKRKSSWKIVSAMLTGGYGEISRRDCGPKIHGSTDGLPGQPTPGSTIDRPIDPYPNVRPK